jgi:hypothetical protein
MSFNITIKKYNKKKYTKKRQYRNNIKGGQRINNSKEIDQEINKLNNVLNELCSFEVTTMNDGISKTIFYDDYNITTKKCKTYRYILKELIKYKPEEELKPKEIIDTVKSQDLSFLDKVDQSKILNTIPKIEEIKSELLPRKMIDKKTLPKYDILVQIIKTILNKLLTLVPKKKL